MSFLAMSLGDWFCVSRNVRVGQGEVGWYNQRMKQNGHVWAWQGKSIRIAITLQLYTVWTQRRSDRKADQMQLEDRLMLHDCIFSCLNFTLGSN